MGEFILREEGFEVVSVTDGQTALVRLADVDPEVVLADVSLPSKTGYEICHLVKTDARFCHTRVILTAGAMEPIDQEEAKRVRADGELRKPFEATAMLDIVKQLVEAARHSRRTAAQAPAAAEAGESKPAREGLLPATPEEEPAKIAPAESVEALVEGPEPVPSEPEPVVEIAATESPAVDSLAPEAAVAESPAPAEVVAETLASLPPEAAAAESLAPEAALAESPAPAEVVAEIVILDAPPVVADLEIAPDAASTVQEEIPIPKPPHWEIDPQAIRAAVTLALEAALPVLIDEVTQRVITALAEEEDRSEAAGAAAAH
jgi:CheY-like chemotaxis protein